MTALGLGAEKLEAVFYGALLKDVGCGACSVVLAPFFAEDELAPRLDLVLVDLHSPRSMGAWARGQLRMDPALPARLARLAAFASQCGAVAHEAMAAHCEIAADFAARLGFADHVQDAVHYQYERHDGQSLAFGRRGDAIPRPARVLHVALAVDVARGLAGAEQAAALVRQRAGTYFDPARLGFPQAGQDRLRRAGLVHDLGKIAVPYRLLDKAGDDTDTRRHLAGTGALAEPVRLHPYYSQRILSRVGALADLAADVGAHHERLDGSGYPLGVAGQHMSPGARVLAAADTWAERARSSTPDLSGETGLDSACLAALRSCARPGIRHQREHTHPGPAGLALSPRELEVLQLLTEGASNPEISKALYVSRRTAEHHVEHILAKLGVTSRTAAVAYALTHELLT